MSRIHTTIETENRLLVARDGGRKEWGVTVNEYVIFGGVMTCSDIGGDVQLCKHTKTTELYTLKG